MNMQPRAKSPASGSHFLAGLRWLQRLLPFLLPDNPKGNLFTDNLKQSQALLTPESSSRKSTGPRG